ncbi:MAG: Mov34/MPN/PAD-1 family protein [Candidatus Woesearchaeota archaeon]|nr:Mov34/MPN/PAD-1 family protein [Candidatus Woesearchaeota archaeon]
MRFMKKIGEWFLRFLGLQKVQQITIEQSVIADVCYMARQAYPKEMLAFFSSTQGVRNGVLHIDEIQLQAYTASTMSASVPLHLLPTFTNIRGTVHSHPSPNNRPSGADKQLFSNYGLVHAIIGKPYTKDTIQFYDKSGEKITVRVV